MVAHFLIKMDGCNNEVEKLKKENRNLAKKVEKLQHAIYCVRLGVFFCGCSYAIGLGKKLGTMVMFMFEYVM